MREVRKNYMSKSLINRLYLKKQLFELKIVKEWMLGII